MTLVAATLPDDPAAVPGWLERRLVGLDLGRLAAELAVVHGPAPMPSLDEALGDRRAAVLADGLGALPADRLGLLLRHPDLLAELQELVLAEGGPYWDRVPREADLTAAVTRGRPADPGTWSASAGQWYRRPWAVAVATAAAVLVAVELPRRWNPPAGPAVAWGWDRPGAIPADGPPAAYLTKLADAADEWFKKRPADAPALAVRLGEFRRGCSTLILADHPPLAEADRTWLREKCRAWAGKIDKHLSDLEAGADPVAVRDAADATVRQLEKALRDRAGQA